LKTLPFIAAICCAFFAFSAGFARQAPADTNLNANPVFQKSCAKCHGKTAEGRHFGGPSLISGKTLAATPEDLRNIIANGKGHMPKFAGKLAAEEIDTLVRQIQALNKR